MLGLLLVLLLDLLRPLVVGLLLRQLLVLLVLLLLQFLAVLVLLRGKLGLLLLVFLVQLGVAGVRRSGPLGRRKIFRMHSRVGVSGSVFCATIFELSRSGRRSDRRPTVVGRIPQRRVFACGVYMRGLRSDRTNMPVMAASTPVPRPRKKLPRTTGILVLSLRKPRI